ncbi:MAG: mandelate racemase/muconate lactonizing enzyme family protein [Geminicoccaceae bacterium]
MISPIVKVEALPVREVVVGQDSLDGSADTVVIRLTDADGRTGIGESDAPPEVVKSFVEMPTAHGWSRRPVDILLGADPVEITALWERLYTGTLFPGCRGLGIHAISGIDIALHDLAGKQLGVPAYKLMGGARRSTLRPYCTIYAGTGSEMSAARIMDGTAAQFERALAAGFRAVKMEVLFEHTATDAELVGYIKEGRRLLGDGITMALDFGYRWSSWHDARWVLQQIADCNIYFAEATLQHDDLHGHARLAAVSPIRICGAEMAATRFEIREWVEIGKVAVVQPDIARCGGLTEIRRIADYCELMGVEVIPHGWKTGILVHAGMHFQAACPASPFFEFLSPAVYDSPLRRDLVVPEPVVENGLVPLPTAPGLGCELSPAYAARLAG